MLGIVKDLQNLLNDKSGFAFDNLKEIGVVINNTRELVELEKKNPKANETVKKIADLFETLGSSQGPVMDQAQLDCVFHVIIS